MKAKERHFLEQLLDGKKLENYKIPVPIKAELRKYQQVTAYTLTLKEQYVPVACDFYGRVGVVSAVVFACCFWGGFCFVFFCAVCTLDS